MADLRTQVMASTSGVALATLTLNPLVIESNQPSHSEPLYL